MLLGTFLQDYFRWHYSSALRQGFSIWSNVLWFCIYFFSLPRLTQTLFSPWRRITEARSQAWSVSDVLGTFFINLLSRLIGTLVRGTVILIGLTALCFLILLGIVWFLIWIIGPMTVLAIGGTGISLIISTLI